MSSVYVWIRGDGWVYCGQTDDLHGEPPLLFAAWAADRCSWSCRRQGSIATHHKGSETCMALCRGDFQGSSPCMLFSPDACLNRGPGMHMASACRE